MDTIFYILLFVFWTFFGSFASVIIHRLKSKESWIMLWRSHCPKCNHQLWFFDLIPIFSYISTLWKCRYCKEKISIIYPILELSTWLLFMLVWVKLINFDLILLLDNLEIIKLLFFLFLAFITIIFIFYDILFLEIHEWVLLTWIIGTSIAVVIQTIDPWLSIIPTLKSSAMWLEWINLWMSSLTFLFILWALYMIMLRWLKEIYDVAILILAIISIVLLKNTLWIDIYNTPMISSILWIMLIFTFLFLQIVISKWTWMWWWDLRIAILMWMILWNSYSFTWIMLTYIIWSIIWIFIIVLQKIQKKENLNTLIPFWPFLWMWLFACLLWQKEIDTLLSSYL